MPNRDMNRTPVVEPKAVVTPVQHAAASRATASAVKIVTKCGKDPAMSPGTSPSIDAERTELLGSLTTQQQQRTSARVIKKLRLEPPIDRDKRPLKKDGADDLPECDTPSKIDEKELKFPTVKQRMPKALWSTDEKNLFFEALNEYGKDFDAITAYICAKMKKKGMPDNLKTKTQVSHFYYRTWHKLSKHVHFDENVKKVAQELYALINYGELRKKLVSVSEKTCARLGEMVLCGSIVVRARGRNLRVRTPMCRALRRLNQITEVALGARVCGRATLLLRARGAGAWAAVQRAAHNPRAAVALPLRTRLAALLRALAARWAASASLRYGKLSEDIKYPEEALKEQEDYTEMNSRLCEEKDVNRDLEDQLNLETDRIFMKGQAGGTRLALHLGPRPDAQIHLPVVSPSEQLSSQKICFSSYLERMGSQRDKDGGAKIRTPKRTRKDSTTEKDKEVDQKKIKIEDPERLIHIEETAIDGIELMASYKSREDDDKPSTEDERERETAEEDGDRDITERDKDMSERDKDLSERDKDMSEREKDSFSEMEDDEKYNKSDTDNESDHGKDKSGKDSKFKNLKVKFRIRPKKRGGSIYTLVMENPEEVKIEEPKAEEQPKVEDETKSDIDVELALRQIRKGWSVYDAGELTIGDLYLMFGSRSKVELDYWWAEPTSPLPQPQKTTPIPEKDKNIDKKEKSDKIPDKPPDKPDKLPEKIDRVSEKIDKIPDKLDKTSDKGADSSLEDEKERARESDNDILSPKNTYSQDSNDGMSGDERKSEQLASPEHKSSSSSSGTLKLVSKLINRPQGPPPPNGFSLLSDRLKRLLALAGNPHVSAAIARCSCGHVCAPQRRQPKQPGYGVPRAEEAAPVFRTPPPIAPRPDAEVSTTDMMLEGVPRWRRGRPRVADRRVVVQRLLPLLPKLPAPTGSAAPAAVCPQKRPALTVVRPPAAPPPLKPPASAPPAPPRILPKPPPTSASDLSFFYVLSESNGQFYFHDGDRRIPITPLAGNGEQHAADSSNGSDRKYNGVKTEEASRSCEHDVTAAKTEDDADAEPKSEQIDVTPDFLPLESMSLSPSRLLHDAGGWLDSSGQDFSLSSFLGHLEGRAQPDLAVDSHLQSLLAESSVDYVAKFADLAAEVTDEPEDLP